MAAWRRKADALLPELRGEFADDKPLTPHLAFFAILPFVLDAHARRDDDALRRAYGFAQWCHHQRAGSDLPNAVGVCFYEHLFDDWSLRQEVVPWLAPEVREAVLPLWEQRLDADQMSELRRLLAQVAPNEPWRALRGVA
jgi:hypothetical protein